MPNTKGAKKRLRQSFVRRERNRATRTKLRTAIRRFREAVVAKSFDDAKGLSLVAGQLLDKAASKGVIHRNKAARLKSRMSRLLVTSQAA